MELTQTIKQAYTQVETYRTQKHRESPSLLFQEYLYTGDREEVCYFIAQAYEKREEKRLVTGRPVVVPYPLGKLEIIRTQKETQGNTLILPSQGDSQSPNTALPEKTDQRNLTHQRQAKKKPLSLFDEYRHRPRPHRTPCILRAYKKPEKPLAIQRVDHVKSTPMGKEEVGRDSPQLPETPPYKRLHQAIEQAGAYQFLNPLQHRLLQTYLTTEQTFTDIQKAEGFKSANGVASNIKKSLGMIFPHLPQEVQQEFKSPIEAVRTKSGHHTESSMRRLRQGMDRVRRERTEKIEFSTDHRTHLSEAASQRWRRSREANKAAQAKG